MSGGAEGILRAEVARLCDVCGLALPAPAGRGRPRERHDDCRDLAARLNQIESILTHLDVTPQAGAAIRGQLLRAANALNRRGGIRWRSEAEREGRPRDPRAGGKKRRRGAT